MIATEVKRLPVIPISANTISSQRRSGSIPNELISSGCKSCVLSQARVAGGYFCLLKGKVDMLNMTPAQAMQGFGYKATEIASGCPQNYQTVEVPVQNGK